MMDVGISWGGVKQSLKIMKNNYKLLRKFINISANIVFLCCMFLFSSLKAAPTPEQIRELEELKLGTPVIKEEEKFLELQTSVVRQKDEDEEDEDCKDCIYGYELFEEVPTTFALSSNMPIPKDYVIGPGDKLKIEYYGNNQDQYEGYVSRSGFFKLPILGPVNLLGLEFSKAEDLIKAKVSNELIGTEVFLSLSELKSINVYVVGAAYKPGTYTVGGLASLTNIIFSTGGPNKVGSLRNIQLKRNGNIVTTFDFYDLLLKGDTSNDKRLQDGDTVYYPLIENTIRIDGAVQRPGRFEIENGDTISVAFGFSGLTSRLDQKIELSRFDSSKGKREVQIFEINDETNQITLQEGDSINVLSSSNQFASNVYLSGEFLYPGYYDISSGDRVSDIIEKAGGFTDNAYPEGAVFTRESVREQQKESYIKTAQNLERSLVDAISSGNQIDGEAYAAISQFIERLKEQDPIGRQVASVDEYSLKSDPSYDFTLQDGDTLYVPKRSSSVSVVGEVLNSTTQIYRNNLTVQDYIELSGGTTDGADLSKIFVILPNGQAVIYKRKLFQEDLDDTLLPGSTIVVSRNPDPYNWFKLASVITPVLSDLAVSAAAIATISDNN